MIAICAFNLTYFLEKEQQDLWIAGINYSILVYLNKYGRVK